MKKLLVTGLGGLLAAAVFASIAATPATADTLDGLTNNSSAAAVQIAEGKKVKVFRRLLKVEDGGKMITFTDPDQKKVTATVSSSRTKVYYSKRLKGLKKAQKEGKTADRSKLKAGLICNITYVAGGNNEPTEVACAVR